MEKFLGVFSSYLYYFILQNISHPNLTVVSKLTKWTFLSTGLSFAYLHRLCKHLLLKGSSLFLEYFGALAHSPRSFPVPHHSLAAVLPMSPWKPVQREVLQADNLHSLITGLTPCSAPSSSCPWPQFILAPHPTPLRLLDILAKENCFFLK